MSVASQNLFAVLDEDAPSKTSGPSRELVKKSTSSKKTDVAPVRAARGPSKKPNYTGNEAAFRNSENGRASNRNKSLEPKEAGNTRGGRPRGAQKTDRHSRTGKVDTEKKIEKGWGNDKKELEDEAAAEVIVKAEEAEEASDVDATPVEESPKTKSLDDYFKEISLQEQEVNAEIALRKANDGKDISGSVLKREQEDFVAASKIKKEKAKKLKEKVHLEVEPVFASPSAGTRERPERRGNERRGGNRGGKPANSNNSRRGPKPSAGPRGGQQKSKGVNLASSEEFPVLGA